MAQIKLTTKGFENMLEKINAAGGDVDRFAKNCLKKSAEIVENQLKEEMSASDVPGELIEKMDKTQLSSDGSRHSATVGYRLGSYDPKNLSDGYKVMFANYGTPKERITKAGKSRGKLPAKGFIARAKKKAAPKVKKLQTEMFEEIQKELDIK